MKKIKYTPDAADKLREISRSILLQYGREKAKDIVGNITSTIRSLTKNENMGPSVEKIFGLDSDYRYLYIAKNYVFYNVEKDSIRIINIYNEKEDFMWLLFGVDTTLQESTDYWGE